MDFAKAFDCVNHKILSNENKSQVAKNFCINARNGIITQQNVVKYLGVHINKQLTWKKAL